MRIHKVFNLTELVRYLACLLLPQLQHLLGHFHWSLALLYRASFLTPPVELPSGQDQRLN